MPDDILRTTLEIVLDQAKFEQTEQQLDNVARIRRSKIELEVDKTAIDGLGKQFRQVQSEIEAYTKSITQSFIKSNTDEIERLQSQLNEVDNKRRARAKSGLEGDEVSRQYDLEAQSIQRRITETNELIAAEEKLHQARLRQNFDLIRQHTQTPEGFTQIGFNTGNTLSGGLAEFNASRAKEENALLEIQRKRTAEAEKELAVIIKRNEALRLPGGKTLIPGELTRFSEREEESRAAALRKTNDQAERELAEKIRRIDSQRLPGGRTLIPGGLTAFNEKEAQSAAVAVQRINDKAESELAEKIKKLEASRLPGGKTLIPGGLTAFNQREAQKVAEEAADLADEAKRRSDRIAEKELAQKIRFLEGQRLPGGKTLTFGGLTEFRRKEQLKEEALEEKELLADDKELASRIKRAEKRAARTGINVPLGDVGKFIHEQEITQSEKEISRADAERIRAQRRGSFEQSAKTIQSKVLNFSSEENEFFDENVEKLAVRHGITSPEEQALLKSRVRKGRFLEPARLNSREALTQLGFAGAFGGIPSLLGGVVGGAIGGVGGVITGSTLAQAAGSILLEKPLALIHEKEAEFKEAGLAYQRSILGITSILQENQTPVSAAGQPLSLRQSQQQQSGEAVRIQTAARSKLLSLGIGGQQEATFVQGIVSALSQRGLSGSPEQIARLSELLGGAIVSQRPGLLDNTQQLLKDLQDVLGGGPNASRTVLSQIIRPALGGIQRGRTTEEILKSAEVLSPLAETAKTLDNPTTALRKFDGAIEYLNQTAGTKLLNATIPAIEKFTEVLKDEKVISGVSKLAESLGDLSALSTRAAAGMVDFSSKFSENLLRPLGAAIPGFATLGLSLAGLTSVLGLINSGAHLISSVREGAPLGTSLGALGGPVVGTAAVAAIVAAVLPEIQKFQIEQSEQKDQATANEQISRIIAARGDSILPKDQAKNLRQTAGLTDEFTSELSKIPVRGQIRSLNQIIGIDESQGPEGFEHARADRNLLSSKEQALFDESSQQYNSFSPYDDRQKSEEQQELTRRDLTRQRKSAADLREQIRTELSDDKANERAVAAQGVATRAGQQVKEQKKLVDDQERALRRLNPIDDPRFLFGSFLDPNNIEKLKKERSQGEGELTTRQAVLGGLKRIQDKAQDNATQTALESLDPTLRKLTPRFKELNDELEKTNLKGVVDITKISEGLIKALGDNAAEAAGKLAGIDKGSAFGQRVAGGVNAQRIQQDAGKLEKALIEQPGDKAILDKINANRLEQLQNSSETGRKQSVREILEGNVGLDLRGFGAQRTEASNVLFAGQTNAAGLRKEIAGLEGSTSDADQTRLAAAKLELRQQNLDNTKQTDEVRINEPVKEITAFDSLRKSTEALADAQLNAALKTHELDRAITAARISLDSFDKQTRLRELGREQTVIGAAQKFLAAGGNAAELGQYHLPSEITFGIDDEDTQKRLALASAREELSAAVDQNLGPKANTRERDARQSLKDQIESETYQKDIAPRQLRDVETSTNIQAIAAYQQFKDVPGLQDLFKGTGTEAFRSLIKSHPDIAKTLKINGSPLGDIANTPDDQLPDIEALTKGIGIGGGATGTSGTSVGGGTDIAGQISTIIADLKQVIHGDLEALKKQLATSTSGTNFSLRELGTTIENSSFNALQREFN